MQLSPEQRQEIDEIKNRRNGVVQPADVVEYARDPNSALHHAFTWDNTRAANQYRLQQARNLISVYVTVVRSQGRIIRVRPLFSNPSIRQEFGLRSGYVDVSVIRSNSRLELSVVSTLLQSAKGMLTHFGAFPNLRRLIAEFITTVEAEKLRMETAITATRQRQKQEQQQARR